MSDDIQTVTAKFVADISSFQSNMRSLVSSAKEVKSSASELSDALSASGSGMQKVEEKATPAANATRQLGAAAHEGQQGMMGMLDSFSQMAGNIQQVVQMVVSFIGALDKSYEATQNAVRSFGNLSLSLEGAKKQYEELANLNASKAFGTDAVVKAQQYFDRLGKSAETTKDEIVKMGDALAAAGQSGDNLTKVIDDMHKLQDSSRATTDQIDQLAKDGIQAWDLLSFGMNKSMEDTKKAVKDGTLSGKQAYQDMMNGVIKDTGAAEQKSHDLSSSWRQLGDAGSKALGPIIDGLTKLLDSINKVEQATHALSGAFQVLSTVWGYGTGIGIPMSFGHASGIMDNPVGHWAMVGERGPEPMYVPEHASIFPSGTNPFAGGSGSALPSLSTLAPSSNGGGAGGGYSGPVTIQIMLDSRLLAEQTVPHMAPIIRAYTGRH